MTTSIDHLIQTLKVCYEDALKDEVKTSIHLFGIKFANELDDHSVNDIAEAATGHRSYGTELRVGMRLAKHVTVNP